MTTAPILGIIIPPSISMILYAMVTNDPLEALFLTGFIPGMLIIVGHVALRLLLLQTPEPARPRRARLLKEPRGPQGERLGAVSAGADFRRHLFRDLHRQRGGGGRLLLCLLRRDLSSTRT